jgi:prevent-host-death family protein
MKPKRKVHRRPIAEPKPTALRDTPPAKPPSLSINVRAAKDQLSSLLEQAAQGNEVIITSDGEPKARLTSVRSRRKPFQVDWKWLESQPVSAGPPAEDLVRADRDGRW